MNENKKYMEDFTKELDDLLKKYKVTLYHENAYGETRFNVSAYSEKIFDTNLDNKDYGKLK